MTLYSDLGVTPDADDLTIRKAYRKRAAKAHPDAGGSREDFEKLTTAKIILLDPLRRRKYDATGEADAEPDNEFSHVLQIAVAAIDSVLRVIESRHGDPCEFQIVKDARLRLKEDIANQESLFADQARVIKTLEKMAARLKAKPGRPNRLRPVFEARIGDKQRERAAKKRDIELMKKAYDLLGDHEFSADDPLRIGSVGWAQAVFT